ncbi:MAG: hypothetical protein HQ472_09610 [Ignavibacteria bacterium]|nr:hypothetical protein [Ignavibacteria bacterium]
MHRKTAIKILLGILTAVVIFHVGIIAKIIPHGIAWGGRIESDSELYVLEFISILVNLLLGVVLLLKGGYVQHKIPARVLNAVLWVFLVLFLLNTVGNVLAESVLEKCFAVLTLVLAALIWILLRKNKN